METPESTTSTASPMGMAAPPHLDLVDDGEHMACLYCIAGQLDQCGGSSDALLKGILSTIEDAWHRPQRLCARILHNDREYRTDNFTESQCWKRVTIEMDGKPTGWLEVRLLDASSQLADEPFAQTDTMLLHAIARCTGRALGHLKARRQLEVERESLQNMNIAMREVLARSKEDEAELKKAVQANVDKVILPILDALATVASDEQRHYVELLRRNLEEITSPFTSALSRRVESLTPVEIQTCDMIRRGLSTKEIAHLRCVSTATVNRHREHIRRKLGLTNQTINLSSYLVGLGSDTIPRNGG